MPRPHPQTLTVGVIAGIAALLFGLPTAASQTGPPTDPECPLAGPCPDPEAGAQTVGARLGLLRRLKEHGDLAAGPLAAGRRTPGVSETRVGAMLRFDSRLDGDLKRELESDGIEFVSRGGRLVRTGTVYLVRLPWDRLDDLSSRETLVRAEATWTPSFTRPLRVTSRKTGAAQLRRSPEFDADGEGVVVGDVDAGFSVFHPHLFRPDGGRFDWIDVDENGQFDPGVDGVDLDGDGAIDEDEKLEVLDGTVHDRTGRDNDDGELQPRRDWVYVDTNFDDRRNFGTADGFEESDPAYGEPIFVADDADRDGLLEPDERLVRLDSSKFKKIVGGDRTFVRGEDLIEYRPDRTDLGRHGTAVVSILAGGQPPFHRRIGLAPAADIVGYDVSDSGESELGEFARTQRAIDDAMGSGVDVLLHEWSDILGTARDGSSNIERALDRAREAGIIQVTPAGNMNLAEKHIERPVEAGETLELPFGVDESSGGLPFRIGWMSVRWDTEQSPTIELVSPSGDEVRLGAGQRSQLGSHAVVSESDVTPRGTRLVLASVSDRDDRLNTGTWRLRMSDISEPDVVKARLMDAQTTWTPGIRWRSPTRDRGTLTLPATADSAVGVAAYGGRPSVSGAGDAESNVDELRGYSGRGPRIDGARAIDVAGPDNPVAALGVSELASDRNRRPGGFRQFGGTSGASPHIAASFALLKQLDPTAQIDRLEERLLEAADTEGLTTEFGEAPNRAWGFGRVDVFGAAAGRDAPSLGPPPEAELEVESGRDRIRFDARSTRSSDRSDLSFRFDFDYDGDWETDWTGDAVRSTSTDAFEPGEVHRARLAVRESDGDRGGAVETFEVPAGSPGDVGPSADGGTDVGGSPAPRRRRNRADGACSIAHGAAPGPSATWLLLSAALAGLRRRRR